MKTKYVIYFTGIFEYGYVTIVWNKPKTENIKYDNPADSLKAATKFRFKFLAKLLCKLMQKSTKDLRTFEVREHKPETINT